MRSFLGILLVSATLAGCASSSFRYKTPLIAERDAPPAPRVLRGGPRRGYVQSR
jgi:hypothetical protein